MTCDIDTYGQIYCSERKFCTPVAVQDVPACSDCPGCVNIWDTSVDDFVADASAAMQFLAEQAAVNSGQTIMVGHSQGACSERQCKQAPYLM